MERGKYFISLTMLKLKSPWKIIPFLKYSVPASKGAAKAIGNLKSEVKSRGLLKHYTLTVWSSEDAMRVFKFSDAHKNAIRNTRRISSELKLIHYYSDTIPTWEEVFQKIKKAPEYDKIKLTNLPAKEENKPLEKNK